MIIQYLDSYDINNLEDIAWIQFEYIDDFLSIDKNKILQIRNKTIIIWSYYNIIENTKFIKNIIKIMEKIKSCNLNNIQIQLPFIKQSFIDVIKMSIKNVSIKQIIDFINQNNIIIEFVINNSIDIYVIQNLIQLWLNNRLVRYSLWPQFFFINYDPLNLLTDRIKEIKQFGKNVNLMIEQFQDKYNINIRSVYLFEAHLAYFYSLKDYITDKKKYEKKFIEHIDKYTYQYKIIHGKNILSVTDRIYHFFEEENDISQKSTKISNKYIYQWLFDNINNIKDIKWNYNYGVFKWLDKEHILNSIDSFYENNYEYFKIR